MKFQGKVLVACGALMLAACDSDNNRSANQAAPVPSAKVQVLHGSFDAPAVNVFVDGTEVLSNVDYKVGSGLLEVEAGTREVRVDGILPGGDATVARIADLLGREPLPLAEAPAQRSVATIDEARCIGCTHCLTACPVDAIVGAQQLMHTVIEAECTGCELCVEPCPVDCIDMRVLA